MPTRPLRCNWLAAALVVLFACLGCHRAAKHRPFSPLHERGQSVTDPEYLESRFRILANDNAGADKWASASDTIALAAHLHRVNGRNGHPELAVEQLRSRANPSVTELISQRIREVGDDEYAVCSMTRSLAHWDLASALPVVREQMPRALAQWQAKRDDEWDAEHLAGCIASYTVVRIEAGDTDAADEYADWIVDTTPLSATVEALSPLWLYPELPALNEAAKTLFLDSKSSWLPLLLPVGKRGNPHDFTGILDTPLVDHPVIRSRMAIELALDQPSADFKVRSYLEFEYRLRRPPRATTQWEVEVSREWDTGSTSGSWARRWFLDPEDPIKPRRARGKVRYGDFLALALASEFEGLAFGLHWRLPQRQAALVEIAARLRDDAPLFVEEPCWLQDRICNLKDLGEDGPIENGPAEVQLAPGL